MAIGHEHERQDAHARDCPSPCRRRRRRAARHVDGGNSEVDHRDEAQAGHRGEADEHEPSIGPGAPGAGRPGHRGAAGRCRPSLARALDHRGGAPAGEASIHSASAPRSPPAPPGPADRRRSAGAGPRRQAPGAAPGSARMPKARWIVVGRLKPCVSSVAISGAICSMPRTKSSRAPSRSLAVASARSSSRAPGWAIGRQDPFWLERAR